jgi:hypothetical protein
MKNVYDGVVTLDAKGKATVTLPAYFEALNGDFRYQLTPIGGPAPNVHIANGVSNNQFKIAGGPPRAKVSWQVTGIRQDRWAKANRPVTEEKKTAKLFGKSEKNSITRARNPKLAKYRDEQQKQRGAMPQASFQAPPRDL